MPHYKNTAGAVYWLDDEKEIDFLPADCVPISDVEAESLRNPPKTPAQIEREASDAAKLALLAIDAGSVRALREWVVLQAGAPQFLKDKEAAAVIERAKVKP